MPALSDSIAPTMGKGPTTPARSRRPPIPQPMAQDVIRYQSPGGSLELLQFSVHQPPGAMLSEGAIDPLLVLFLYGQKIRSLFVISQDDAQSHIA
jgi:hypothetical protein